MTSSSRSAPAGDNAILIVEDDVQFAEVLCAFLRLQGYKPDRVTLLGQAFGAIEQTGFKTVLLDLSLPDSRWDKTLDRVPALLNQGVERVVVMTGSDVCFALCDRAQEAGVECVLAKNVPKFLPALAATLRQKDAGQGR